ISFVSIFLQSLLDILLKLGRDVFRKLELGWLRSEDPGNRVVRRFSFERRTATQHFIKHDAETPNIGSLVYFRFAQLFGRHVFDGSHYRARLGAHVSGCVLDLSLLRQDFGELSEAEVYDLHVTVRPQHDVFGFYVAMDDTDCMGAGQCGADLNYYL